MERKDKEDKESGLIYVITYYCSSIKTYLSQHTHTQHHELVKGMLYQTAEDSVLERQVTTLQR